MTSVTVAVLTFRRPEDLQLIIPRLLEQLDSVDHPAELLVVDNDPAGSAKSIVEAHEDPRMGYVNETTPGIAAARNRAMEMSVGSDVLVFIDDDERPTPQWLSTLLTTFEQSRPACVVGPVTSEFAHEPDPWIVAGGFFQRRTLPTGTEVRVAATNNLLIDLRQIATLGVRFNLKYGIIGGSDHLFTRQISARGGRLVWCAEAMVTDVVPSERLTRSWVMRRAFRMGNGTALVDLDMARFRATASPGPVLVARLKLLFQGAVRVLFGLLRVAFGLVFGSLKQKASGSRNVARGSGLMVGALSISYAEYARRKDR